MHVAHRYTALSLTTCLAIGGATVYAAMPSRETIVREHAVPVAIPVPVTVYVQPAHARELRVPWDTAFGDDITAHPPVGPFPDLSAVCAALDTKESRDRFEGCHPGERDLLEGDGPFLRIGEVAVWEPTAPYAMPVRTVHLAVQTRAGWYVLPAIGDTGNRYSGLSFDPARAGSGLVITYQSDMSTAGRFASRVEEGIIACEVTAGAVACTPMIPAHKYSPQINTQAPGWPSSTTVELACTVAYHDRAVTIAPMPKPARPVDEDWTQQAAAACRTGTRTVAF
jgi:hypothetical protein